jgi:hypothetical protein
LNLGEAGAVGVGGDLLIDFKSEGKSGASGVAGDARLRAVAHG